MPKHLHILYNLLALLIISYVGVDLFYRVVRVQLEQVGSIEVTAPVAIVEKKPAGPVLTYQKISERNIFGAVLEGEAPAEKEVAEIETLEPTTLKLVLLGTIAGDQGNTRAIIMDEVKKAQNLYREGDSVQDAVVQKILRGKVVLRVGDRDEILGMEEENSPQARNIYVDAKPKSRGSAVSLDRQELQDMGNIKNILTQVRLRPYFKAGKSDGLLADHIKADSMLAKIGLVDGDIIQGINGRRISNPEDVMEFYRGLETGSQLNVQVNRKGRTKILNFNVK